MVSYNGHMESIAIVESEWPYVLSMMPDDLEQSAMDKLALRRRREITSGGDLLRLALCYGFCDLTLESSRAARRFRLW